MLLFPFLVARAGVLVNEILPDPPGPDDGLEWIELHNPGPFTVDLQGWAIEVATQNWTVRHVFGPTLLESDAYLVVGADGVPPSNGPLRLGNASNSGDGVRLLDATGQVVDTVLYGPTNSDLLRDDQGDVPATLAPAPAPGEALGRRSAGHDTDAAADWALLAPTPGLPNPVASIDCDAANVGVRIEELLVDPTGPDAGREWVEIRATAGPADLSGWALFAGTRNYGEVARLPEGTWIDDGEHLLVGGPDVPGASWVAPALQLGNGSGGDAVQLRDCTGAIADTVVYGDANTDGWLDDRGEEATPAPRPAPGEALGRIRVEDTDQGTDFAPLPPSPGLPNPNPCDGEGLVVDALAPHREAWVELLHTGTAPIPLTGWSLERWEGERWILAAPLGSAILQPGARFRVGSVDVEERSATLLHGLYAGPGTNGVRLVDCTGRVVDTVIYGGPDPAGLFDDDGAPARPAPLPDPGAWLARSPPGRDTDDASADFTLLEGDGWTSPLLINEVLADPEGTDEGNEWVEIHNRTDAPVDLTGWSLRIDSDPSPLPTVTVAPGAWFLVDDSVFSHDLPNRGPTVLQLLDPHGRIADQLSYADDGTMIGAAPEGRSLARIADGHDTDGPEDWRPGFPTPGASNRTIPSATLSGCGTPHSAPPPTLGCSTDPARSSLLFLFRRRGPLVDP